MIEACFTAASQSVAAWLSAAAMHLAPMTSALQTAAEHLIA